MKQKWNNCWKFEHKSERLSLSNKISPFENIFTLTNKKDSLIIRQDEKIKICIKVGFYNLPACSMLKFAEIIPFKQLHFIYFSEPTTHVSTSELCDARVEVNVQFVKQDCYKITINSTYTTFFSSREISEPAITEIVNRKKLTEILGFLEPKINLGVFYLPFGTCFSKK